MVFDSYCKAPLAFSPSSYYIDSGLLLQDLGSQWVAEEYTIDLEIVL